MTSTDDVRIMLERLTQTAAKYVFGKSGEPLTGASLEEARVKLARAIDDAWDVLRPPCISEDATPAPASEATSDQFTAPLAGRIQVRAGNDPQCPRTITGHLPDDTYRCEGYRGHPGLHHVWLGDQRTTWGEDGIPIGERDSR